MKFAFTRKTNEQTNRIEQGVWVSLDDKKFEGELILDDPRDGPAVRVCSTDSRRYKDGYDKGVRQYRKVIRGDDFISWSIREKIENSGMMEAITGWVGVMDDEGTEVMFTKDAVREALEGAPDFRRRVLEVATDLAHYRKQEAEEDTENLSRSSAMNANGAEPNPENQAGAIPLH